MLERVYNAWLALSGKLPTGQAEQKSNPLALIDLQPGFDSAANGQPRNDDPDANMSSLQAEPWAYRCANANGIALASSILVPEVKRTVNGAIEWAPLDDEKHPLTRLCSRPNPYTTIEELLWKMSLSLDGDGNAYLCRDPEATRDDAEEWWWGDSTTAKVHTDGNGEIVKYSFTRYARRIELDAVDVAHIKFPNPFSPYYGLSPIIAAHMSILTLFHDRRYLKNFYKNAGIPGGVGESDAQMPSPDDLNRMRKEWRRKFTGPNQHDIAFLFEGLKYKPITPPLKDLVVDIVRRMSREEIAACLGVPPVVLGIVEDANRSNSDDQWRGYYEGNIIPRQKLMARGITIHLVQPKFGENYRVRFDNSNRDFLQEDQNVKSERTVRLYRGGIVTRNEAREAMGYEATPDGDEFFQIQSGFGFDYQDDDEKNYGGNSRDVVTAPSASRLIVKTDDTRLKLWKQHDANLNKYEKRVEGVIRKYWDSQIDRLVAKINGKTLNGILPSQLSWMLYKDDNPVNPGDAGGFFDLAGENLELRRVLDPVITEIVNVSGQEALTHFLIDFQFNLKDPKVQTLIGQFLNRSERINDTTYEKVREILQQAYDEGVGIPEVERRLRDLFESYYRVEPGDPDKITRGRRFARTEMNGAVNGASQASWEQAGVEKKQWLSTRDSRTRTAHANADGEVVGINEPFIMTGEPLMYPGDSSGSAHNVINCRCRHLPVV